MIVGPSIGKRYFGLFLSPFLIILNSSRLFSLLYYVPLSGVRCNCMVAVSAPCGMRLGAGEAWRRGQRAEGIGDFGLRILDCVMSEGQRDLGKAKSKRA